MKNKKKNPPPLPWYLRATNGAIPGAVIGAGVGSVVPLIGTAIGGLLGAIIGAAIGVAFTSVVEADEEMELQKAKKAKSAEPSENEIDEDEDETESWPEKVWYRPSPTRVFTPDSRIFFGAGAGAGIGGAIGTLVFPVVGTAIGAAIGGALGGLVGYIYPKIANYTASKKVVRVEAERKWYKESSYDSPVYVRIFIGITAGSVLGATIGSVVPVIGTVIGGAAGALIGAGLAAASPAFFAGMRGLFSGDKTADDKIELSEPAAKKPKARKWYHESGMEMPWYARALAGICGGAALGGAFGSVVPGIGTAVGAVVGAAIAGTLAVASPAMFAGARSALQNIIGKKEKSGDKEQTEKTTTTPDNSLDIPWYLRFFAGVTGGIAVGAALGTVVPGIGNVVGAVAGGIIGASLAVGTPGIRSLANKISSAFSNIKQTTSPDVKSEDAKNVDNIPWYMRLAAGVTAGAAIGGAVGTVVPVIGNAIGLLAGTLIGAAVFVAGPPLYRAAKHAINKVQEELSVSKKVERCIEKINRLERQWPRELNQKDDLTIQKAGENLPNMNKSAKKELGEAYATLLRHRPDYANKPLSSTRGPGFWSRSNSEVKEADSKHEISKSTGEETAPEKEGYTL